MPCVSVRNNHARRTSIKAANIERKNNRENTRLAKKQQSAAAKSAKITAKNAQTQAKAIAKSTRAQAKSAAKTAKVQAKIDAKSLKTRQSLEKRVTKKHQAHRAKVKAAHAKALKIQAKSAAKATKAAAKNTAKSAKLAAKAARTQAKSQSRAAKVNQLKTSIKKVKPPRLKPAISKTISKVSKIAKSAKITAKKQTKVKKSQELGAESSRAAKISGANVQNSLKIPHTRASVQESASAPIYISAPSRAPKPLRRTAFMTRGDLINAESRLGSTIFGPVPAGHRREFFHDQENIWIWFESWRDETDHPRQLTVRYEVRPSGIYKKISAGSYFKLAGDELENFRRATHAYLHIVKKYLYPNVAATH